ncbi:hypothetical protein BKA69DRAFT_1123154 [Paraphysoderma sedebokerense]|nr:hypothetical protein BKA69DRAFT_1123154 [Paraphysoderma sedebokerense]
MLTGLQPLRAQISLFKSSPLSARFFSSTTRLNDKKDNSGGPPYQYNQLNCSLHPRKLSPKVIDLIRDYPSFVHVAVQWGDQDSFLHLNNVMYARYFETARMTYICDFSTLLPPPFRTTFFNPGTTHIGPIVASQFIRYKAPVFYPDTLTVAIRTKPSDLEKLRNDKDNVLDRLDLEFVMVSHRLEKIAADGFANCVTFDYAKGRKCPAPVEVKEAISQWEDLGRKQWK